MKVAVSSTGSTLKDTVHTSFGRCDFFLMVDTETMQSSAVKNEFSGAATGAGTACAQVVFDHGAQAVISGQVGPNAFEVLEQGGIEIFLCPPGLSAEEAVGKHKEGTLRKMHITKF